MAASANRSSRLVSLFRTVMDDFRNLDKNFTQSNNYYQFAVQQMDKVATEGKVITPKDDTPHIASTYAVYLESTRQLNELQSRYKGGERTIEESANLVGLKLPETERA